jgi:hypothetical protein
VFGRIVRVQDERFDVGWAEPEYAGFTMIDPDRCMIVMFGHEISPFLSVKQHDERRTSI